MQVRRAETHQAGIGRVLDIRLERLARLFQRFIEFLLDPVEGREVDGVVLEFHGGVSLKSIGALERKHIAVVDAFQVRVREIRHFAGSEHEQTAGLEQIGERISSSRRRSRASRSTP